MKIIKIAVLAVTVAILSPSQQALAQSESGASPVEAFFCNLQEGKTMRDLMQVSGRFAKWADRHDPDYSAWILTPRFGQFMQMTQVVWLGSNQSGNTMGKGLDAWIETGADIQDDFDEVLACLAHGVASSVEINAPDGPPGDGVVMFSECQIDDDADWSKAVAAHKNAASAMRSSGARNSNWLFFPMIGGPPDREFDYWSVSTFDSWTDYFAAYEIYVNGGGWQQQGQALQGSARCMIGSPTVWDVRLVRQAER